MKIAITGATGNMGTETLSEVLKINEIEKVNLLVLPNDKRIKHLLKKHKSHKSKICVIQGSLANKTACEKLCDGVDIVLNLAACIPPHSDQHPESAIECNEKGVNTLVGVIENMENQPKLVHISTVALYGNRNHLHMWGRIGDPLLVSPYDIYSATKMRGEFRVLESKIKTWVVIRQTAMLHINMLKDNMSDGLMFHTCFNAPLEWATAHDSGVLMANILRKEIAGKLGDDFWKRCYNLGNPINRITGYNTLNDGFKLIGGSTKDFFNTNYNATRNFHGVWFYDSNVLNDLFDYQKQSTDVYWKEISKKYWYYKLGKIVPKKVIKKFAIDRLLKNPNSPAYWYNHKDEGKMLAYFGGTQEYQKIPKKWTGFGLLVEGKSTENDPVDYEALKNIKNAKLVDLYYDTNKPVSKINLADLKNVAKAHGGKLLTKTFKDGDIYRTLEWETQDGEKFSANAHTVLCAGHWHNVTYKENKWDFDRLSKKDKIYAQVWYDSHKEDENCVYYFDKNFEAKVKRFK